MWETAKPWLFPLYCCWRQSCLGDREYQDEMMSAAVGVLGRFQALQFAYSGELSHLAGDYAKTWA